MNTQNTIEQATQEAQVCVGLKYSQAKRLQANYRDCSSLVARAYTAAGYVWGCHGKPVPRSLEEVYEDGFELIWPTDYSKIGKSLPTSSVTRKGIGLRRGDLVYAATKGKSSGRANKIEHVMMMTSGTRIVHARGSAYGVREDNISLYDKCLCAVTRFNPSCDLVKGHIGNRVRALQRALNTVHNAGLDVDGEFGSKTRLTIETYQEAWGLPITGVGDAATRASLGITDDTTYLSTTRPVLSVGDKGAAVREMQSLLVARGEHLPKYGMDGDFGAETFAALTSYQAKQGINEDGICGPITWAHLTGETDDGVAPAADDLYVHVTAAKSANVRTLPGTNGEVRGVVLKDALLKATGGYATVGTTIWYNVIYDGESVWISGKMAQPLSDQPSESPDAPYVEKGKKPDISKWQGKISFEKMASEADFVIARGLCRTTKDAMIDTYAKDMRANGIPFGVYDFTYAKTVSEGRRDAKLFFEACGGLNPLYYVLDAEVSTLNQDIIAAWAKTMRELTDRPIGCYVAHHMYGKYKFKQVANLFDFVWIPRYGINDGKQHTKPAYPCDLWQYTSMGKIAGVKGRVDLNVILPGGKSLAWFRGEEGGESIEP